MVEHSASNPAADQTAPGEVSAATAADAGLATELASARERLAFYESFDVLIRDNVQRSGELLRQVAAEQERTDQKLAAMRAELDQRLGEQRSALAEIATGLSGLQANLGAISARVAASLAALAEPPEAASTGETSPRQDVEVDQAAGMSDVAFADQAATTSGTDAAEIPDLSVPPGAPDSPPIPALATRTPAVASTGPPAQPMTREAGGIAVDAPDDGDLPARKKIDLIIHGVPKAATALSLQRYLQELSDVDAVEVREYVSGVLRFQMTATAFEPGDLRHWGDGEGLETVTARDNVIELKLATAEGF